MSSPASAARLTYRLCSGDDTRHEQTMADTQLWDYGSRMGLKR
jgi:hypothetical protein